MLHDATNRELLAAWQNGSEAAASVLVARYMARLTALARARLSGKLARRVEPDDIVLSAWRSFFVAADGKRIAVPDDDNLWPLLVTLTLRKLHRQADRHFADRRSVAAEADAFEPSEWQSIVARDPTPFETALVTDEVERLMAGLAESDREILSRRLQGEEQSEIARHVGCSERTVRRVLRSIRASFSEQQAEAAMSAPRIRTENSPRVEIEEQHDLVHTDGPTLQPTIDYRDILLQKLIGQGAFGRVYRARQAGHSDCVAVKFLRKEYWQKPAIAGLLQREAELVRRLIHPGIVPHRGWGLTGGGAAFSVMEFIEGLNLLDWRNCSSIPVGEVVRCGLELCNSLTAAHAAGVIHGDVTPSNVLRRDDGRFVLIDFGFGHLAGRPRPLAVAGTPGFLAPEQLCPEFGQLSIRTDVYGAAGVLYFLLSGHPPIAGDTPADTIAMTISGSEVPAVRSLVPSVPAELDQLLSDCLAKESGCRPQTMAQFAARLAGLQ